MEAPEANMELGAAGLGGSKVELHISCSNLVNMDTFSLSDPIVIMYVKNGSSWEEFGRTEMIKDNLNPKFVRSMKIDYHFESVQPLKFACYDIDNIKAGLEKQDFIGESYCNLAEIVTAAGQKLTRPLRLPNKPQARRGNITIHCEEVQELNYNVTMRFDAQKLDKKDLFGKSDPFLVISRLREDGVSVPVAKTEVIRKTLDPQWRPFTLSVQRLCNGDYERPLVFEVWDWNRSGKHDFIGRFTTNLRSLTEGQQKQWKVVNDKMKRKKKRYSDSGTVFLREIKVTKTHSFLDYIQGGCEIALVVAIDFTASNGNPKYNNSLHFDNPGAPNEYMQAISSVCEILTAYDSDDLYPVFGFGAKIPPRNQVSHCFPLNGNPADPEVPGLQGILDVYRRALSEVTLYGPTIFAQVLRTGFEMAEEHATQDTQSYYILLIITDGVLDDLQASIDEIVRGNDRPLSIIIVGVGNADFEKMDILDADDDPLQATWGDIAKRDIVQFVPFRKFRDRPSELARQVLEEVPGQLLSYMKSRGIRPNPPRPADAVRMGGGLNSNAAPAPYASGGVHPVAAYDAAYQAGPRGQYADLTQVPRPAPPMGSGAPQQQYASNPYAAPPANPYAVGGQQPAMNPYAAPPGQNPYAAPPGQNPYAMPPGQQQQQQQQRQPQAPPRQYSPAQVGGHRVLPQAGGSNGNLPRSSGQGGNYGALYQ